MIRFAKPATIATFALAGVMLASLPSTSQARNNDGAAIAAGIVGGLVIGGLAAAAVSDGYGPSPAAPYYGPRYVPAHGPGYYDGYGPRRGDYRRHRPRCWVETQTYYNRWGRLRHRDVEVCR